MFKPITFEENDRGGFRTITSTSAAARVLTEWWAAEHTSGYVDALMACQSALDGTGSDEAAQAAFLAALNEAGVFVRE